MPRSEKPRRTPASNFNTKCTSLLAPRSPILRLDFLHGIYSFLCYRMKTPHNPFVSSRQAFEKRDRSPFRHLPKRERAPEANIFTRVRKSCKQHIVRSVAMAVGKGLCRFPSNTRILRLVFYCSLESPDGLLGA